MSGTPALVGRSSARQVERVGALADLVRHVEDALGSSATLHEIHRALVRLVLRKLAARALAWMALDPPRSAALFAVSAAEDTLDRDPAVERGVEAALSVELAELRQSTELFPERLGGVFEGLLALELTGNPGARTLLVTRGRKRTGSFFTPSALAAQVVERALEVVPEGKLEGALTICDPACGAGAFLLAAARSVLARTRAARGRSDVLWDERAERRRIVEHCLAGVDLDPLAVAVTELALWSFVGDPSLSPSRAGRLHAGDAITGLGLAGHGPALAGQPGFDWGAAFPDLLGFDVVVGNPPWIAYAGRATQPIEADRRAFLARRYAAFRGYPTLHAVFVERALELAPRGVVALVVPSPLADLDGYRPLRRVLQSTHEPCEPMLEFGQDAFAEVTQPCFALIARPRTSAPLVDSSRPFRLIERARHGAAARAVEVPRALLRLREGDRMPAELFGEMGFQSTRSVREALFQRLDCARGEHTYPLLEGRDVREFRVGSPRLFLRPDGDVLRKARCRLRPIEEYSRVRLVVRQTAKVPIAALHSSVPFRNSLLAGFSTEALPAELVVGLLNSSLYRAFHLTLQRDARQAVFPQVKVAHLRALPRPPSRHPQKMAELCALVSRITATPGDAELLCALDDLVFSWFDFTDSDRAETRALLAERAPELAR